MYERNLKATSNFFIMKFIEWIDKLDLTQQQKSFEIK